MDEVEKKWLVFGMVLILLAVIPATALATPNGQPFDEIWAEMGDHQAEIEAETAARIAGDLALLEAINAEEAARIAADSALQADLDSESTARIDGDTALHDALDAEEVARIAGDVSLQAALDSEEDARIAGDDSLQDALDAEVAARIAADNVLQVAIGAEEAARIAADNALQSNIDDLAALDALDYDSLEDLEDATADGFNMATNSGKVGIGTTDPQGLLEVKTGGSIGPQVLDQSQTATGYYQPFDKDCWQTFTAGVTGKFTRVDLFFGRQRGWETLRVYEGAGLGGTLLHTDTIYAPHMAWRACTFTTPVNVTAGEKYTIRLSYSSGIYGTAWGWMRSTSYTDGNGYGNSMRANDDYNFKTYVRPVSPDLIVSTEGDVGIGLLDPSSKLDVGGNIEIGSGDAFYFGDPDTDGSWRITRSGSNLIFQRRESGTWVTKDTMTP
jgi:hypothetical protein